MESLLNSEQKKRYQEFKEFVAAQVEPFAERWDREQQHPASIISALGQRRLFGQHCARRLRRQRLGLCHLWSAQRSVWLRIVGLDRLAYRPGNGLDDFTQMGHG